MEINNIVKLVNDDQILPGVNDLVNILYNDELNECIFIDPRGYFGESSIFGISEYDDAKIKFALTGYDEFDNRLINNLNIKDNNIEIFIDFLDESIINDKSLSTLLMITIWLGNSHCFISNEYKAIYSYFIALYLGLSYFSE